MEILDYSVNREKIKNLLKIYMEKELLIPIVGAGFSRGACTAHGGHVPFGKEFKAELLKFLVDYACYEQSEIEIYKHKSINDIADDFWIELKNNQELLKAFQKYMRDNFSCTKDIPAEKKNFLHANWPAVYTLNYDDVIESCLGKEYKIIYPYDKQNETVIQKEKCIFKIHGDITRYINTGDPKYLVLGREAYVNTLMDPDNDCMLKTLRKDFYTKSIIFVGCSLVDELDLLYASGMQLKKKIDVNNEHIIVYVRYINDCKKDISRLDNNKFISYGITHVVNVDSQSIKDLYYDLFMISSSMKKETITDGLEKFRGYKFVIDSSVEKNKDYEFLRGKNTLNEGSKTLSLPSFFISRGCIGNGIITELIDEERQEKNTVIYFLAGQKVSGRTYCLIDILHRLQLKDIYYFPTGTSLSDKSLDLLLEYKNIYLLFDENVLTRDQLVDVIDKCHILQRKNIKIVIAVNRSDGHFFSYYLAHQENLTKYASVVILSNKFENKEILNFNEKISKLSLMDYKAKDTILDYLYQFWHTDLSNGNNISYEKLPDINFLSVESCSEVKAMIVLATEIRVSSDMAIQLEIDEALYHLMERYGQFIQKYYTLNSIEDDWASGFKFVLNSSSWAIMVLSAFASDKNNHDAIASVYHSILSTYINTSAGVKNTRQIVRKYSFLDDIQRIFYNKEYRGSLQLPYKIYEKIHPLLANEYQFLHQAAKCKLQLARKTIKEGRRNETVSYLSDAYFNITRAYDLVKNLEYRNVNYTKLHMSLTEALILSNYLLNGLNPEKEIEHQKLAIDAYYRVFCEFGRIGNRFERKEIKDIENFINYMLNNNKVSNEYKRRFEAFVNEFRDIKIENTSEYMLKNFLNN